MSITRKSNDAEAPTVGPARSSARPGPVHAHCHFCQLPVPAVCASDEDVYCCFGCRFAEAVTESRGESGQVNWIMARLGIAVFLSMIVMMLSMYQYRGQIAIEAGSLPSELFHQLGGLLQYVSLILSTPVVIILGLPILSSAASQWRARMASTDALVVLGVAAAFICSYVSTLAGRGATYYETGCVVLVFMTLGRWLDASGRLRATDAVRSLESLFPDRVDVTRDGKTLSLRPDEVATGDEMAIPPGQRIAADGIIVRGRGHIDEQIVTGESEPITRDVGELVRAGTMNVNGALRVRATAVGADSTLGRLVRLLEAARQARTPYQRLADRITSIFVPVVIAIAFAALILGIRRRGLDEGIMSALAVMLIACPCALGIATPLATWVALGHAAKNRILIRDGETLERLARIRAVCIDKTGTLTSGRPQVATLIVGAEDEPMRDVVLTRACAISAGSTHVMAQAIHRFASAGPHCAAIATSVQSIAGRGLAGDINGELILLGSEKLMRERGLTAEPPIDASLHASRVPLLSSDGAGVPLAACLPLTSQPDVKGPPVRAAQSIVCIGWADRIRGVFALDETLRPIARATIDSLRRRGLVVTILTGDHAARGRALAAALAVDVRAELLPEDKVRAICELRAAVGPVAMVGDGLNDAPALAAADVGIALACGADLTRESAAICLLNDDLAAIPRIIDLSRRTMRTIRVNLFAAFAYNAVGIGLAVTGRLNPIFAAGAMVVSSLLVIGNSLRLGLDRHMTNTQRPSSTAGMPLLSSSAASSAA